MTKRYLGVIGLAEAFGVSRHAVHKWRSRYPSASSHPFPEPDVEVDGAPGWAPDRWDELMQWREGLPGRGAGGGRPPAQILGPASDPSAAHQEYFAEASVHGFTRDEAERVLRTFCDEFPEMTEAQVCAWVVGKWRD